MNEANKDIRTTAKRHGVFLWEIAARLGVSEPTLTRWMRFDLSEEKKEKILAAIRDISTQKREGC